MNKIKLLLHQQAKQNVIKREKHELKREVEQEYKQLLYDSQFQKADQKTILKIKKIAQHLPSAHSMGIAALNHTIDGILDDYIKQKKYHPKSLKEIEEYTQTGEWPKFLLSEV
jgi:ABC-type lipopolysaccharide export system ATPase subunit